MKPTIILVGADKGGVGKTTLSRALLDLLARKNVTARAFDTEYPRGTLKRFHPKVTEIVDVTAASDQMRMLDTLTTSDAKITVIDIRAGLLSPTLKAFTDVGFFDLVHGQIGVAPNGVELHAVLDICWGPDCASTLSVSASTTSGVASSVAADLPKPLKGAAGPP